MATYTASGDSTQTLDHVILYSDKFYLYGSSRLGLLASTQSVDSLDSTTVGYTAPWTGNNISWSKGAKQYELDNHLGNVLVTVSDDKLGVHQTSDSSLIDHYTPLVVNAQDYYPFGMLMQGRSSTFPGYRYGFKGKELDNEAKGPGMQLDYGARYYDPRVGRFLSVDRKTANFPFYSPYGFAANSPIKNLDLDGNEPKSYSEDWIHLDLFDLNSHKKVSSQGTVRLYDPKIGYIDAYAIYDNWGKQQWILGEVDNKHYYFESDNGNSSEMTIHPIKGTDKNVVRGGHFEEYETQEELQSRYASGSADILGETFGALVTAPFAYELAATLGSGYISTAAAAQTSYRLAGAGANAGFQYIQNAPKNGWGVENFKNMNLTSVSLSFINPLSVTTNAFGSNFGKLTIANGSDNAIGGKQFNFKSAAFGTLIDAAGGKLGGKFEKLSLKFGNFTDYQGKIFGDVLRGAVTTPTNIIVDQKLNSNNQNEK
jgi:RHS repeat-associated protein